MTNTNPETPHVNYDDVLTIQLTRRELSDLLTALAGDRTGAEWNLLYNAAWTERSDTSTPHSPTHKERRPARNAITVTLTAEQIALVIELLPMPLERELIEENLSATLRNEICAELDQVVEIVEILNEALEVLHEYVL